MHFRGKNDANYWLLVLQYCREEKMAIVVTYETVKPWPLPLFFCGPEVSHTWDGCSSGWFYRVAQRVHYKIQKKNMETKTAPITLYVNICSRAYGFYLNLFDWIEFISFVTQYNLFCRWSFCCCELAFFWFFIHMA